MKILLYDKIYIINPLKEVIDFVKSHFIYSNPKRNQEQVVIFSGKTEIDLPFDFYSIILVQYNDSHNRKYRICRDYSLKKNKLIVKDPQKNYKVIYQPLPELSTCFCSDNLIVLLSGAFDKLKNFLVEKFPNISNHIETDLGHFKTDSNHIEKVSNLLESLRNISNLFGTNLSHIETDLSHLETFLKRLETSLKGFDMILIDLRKIKSISIKWKEKIILRDYQKDAVDEMLKHKNGILQAPCGSGKTIMMLYLMKKIQQSTLILVDELKLMKQWESQVKKFFDIDKVGRIGDGYFKIQPITIATIQTLWRLPSEKFQKLNDYFGMTIVDECHTVPSYTFQVVVNKLASLYKFGTSATPYRGDHLEFLMFDSIGPIRYRVKDSFLKELFVPIVIYPIFTNRLYKLTNPPDNYYQKLFWRKLLVDRLIRDSKRNDLIIENVKKHKGLHLVLSERVDHCEYLYKKIKPFKKTRLLIGKVKAEEREKIRNDDSIEVIIGTSVADKGLDIPRIQYIHLIIPTTNQKNLIQRIGRGARPFPDKEACLVFDYIDIDDYFKESFKKRVYLYKRKNYRFLSLESDLLRRLKDERF